MDFKLRGNLGYMIGILITFLILPAIPGMLMMCAAELSLQAWVPILAYVVFVWCVMPLSGAVISVCHVVKRDRFCPLLVLEAAICLGLALSVIQAGMGGAFHYTILLTLFASVGVILLTECFALLGRWESRYSDGGIWGILGGLAVNRRYLALVYFWSISLLIALQQMISYLYGWQIHPTKLALAWIPPFLLLTALFHLRKGNPLTLGGLLGLLVMCPISLLLSSQINLTLHWRANLAWMALGYGLVLLVEAIGWLYRRGRPKDGKFTAEDSSD